MIKLGSAELAQLVRLCAMLGIHLSYSPDRWHCTLLLLGESTSKKIAAIRDAMRTFDGEPFLVAFDRIEGATLKPRRGMHGPGAFQRALVRHVAATGLALPDYTFGLHLNLAYGIASDRRVPIPTLAWSVEEILLVESVNGKGRHIHLGRWALETRQQSLAFA